MHKLQSARPKSLKLHALLLNLAVERHTVKSPRWRSLKSGVATACTGISSSHKPTRCRVRTILQCCHALPAINSYLKACRSSNLVGRLHCTC